MVDLLQSLLGPIFFKEAVEIARRRRYYLARTLYCGTLVVTLLLILADSWYWRHRSPSINMLARIAEELFVMASVIQFGAVFLFVPLFLGGAIAGEREERTLDLLFTTHLSNREIVFGKLGSRVAAMVTLILCGLPVLSLIVLFFGGVAPEALWRVLAVTLLAVVCVSAVSLYFSVATEGTLGSLVRTYAWLAIWLAGVPALVAIVLEMLRVRGAIHWQMLGVLTLVNPACLFATAVDGFMYNSMAGSWSAWFFPASFVLPTLFSVVILRRAVVRLRLPPKPALSLITRLPIARWFWQRSQRPELVAQRRQTAHLTRLGGVVTNPLWLRSRLAPVYDRSRHITMIQWGGWAFVGLILALISIAAPRELSDEELSMVIVGMAWGAVGALVLLVAGTSLVGDRRRGFLELVLVTPLSSRAIVDGTLLACWEHIRQLFWLPCALGVFFVLTGASLPLGVLAATITAVLFCTVVAYHSIACSAVARSMPAALAGTVTLPLAVIVGLPLLSVTFEEVHAVVLWILTLVALIFTTQWIRRRSLSPASVAAFSTAIHLFIAALATFWTFESSRRRDEYPAVAMHPAVLVVATLDDRPDHWFGYRLRSWPLIFPCYWIGLIVNILFLRRWLIRRFDAMAERTPAEDDDALLSKLIPTAKADASRPQPDHLAGSASGATLR